MNPSARPPADSRRILLAAAVIVLAGLAAYHNSFSGPFIYDDAPAILDNRSIRHLWTALAPPHGEGLTVEGRPILNLSLAVNYAISGTAVWSYHALNVLIHLCAGLALFGIVRRTALRWSALSPTRSPAAGGATFFAWAVALIWTVHPLQTEAVTYVIQRAESLMGLFYLLTLYCFIRGTEVAADLRAAEDSPRALCRPEVGSHLWYVLSWLACLLGMATKEVMVTAPVMVFFYDRTFVSGGFREAWRRHRRAYLALGSTWILLAGLVAWTGGNRSGSAGFDLGISWWAYVLTQFQAIVWYLRLAVWPHPLVFEYGTFWVSLSTAAPYLAAVGVLAALTIWALVRAPALGFLGFWFFGILAPTSLTPGTTQMIVEHRMYLPLAAVVALFVLGLQALIRRNLDRAERELDPSDVH